MLRICGYGLQLREGEARLASQRLFLLSILFERGFTLLTDVTGERWRLAGRRAAEELGVLFTAFAIGPGGDFDGHEADWTELYGVDAGGAVLVRADGHVAWRSRRNSSEPEAIMRTVLRMVARR